MNVSGYNVATENINSVINEFEVSGEKASTNSNTKDY
jgi:hypothetical protein